MSAASVMSKTWGAEQGAEWAEDYALEALEFASWAIAQAEAAALEAADARWRAVACL